MKKSSLIYIHTNPLDSKMANMVQVIAMCDAFSQIGYDVTLLLPISNSKADNFEFLSSRYNVYSKFSLDFFKQNKRLGKGFGSLRGIYKLISKYEGGQFFLRDPLISILLILRKQRVITELHNNILHRRPFLDKVKKVIFKKIARKSEMKAIITISESLKSSWQNIGLPTKKIFALHDAVSDSAFKNPISIRDAKNNLRLEISQNYAVYVGNISLDRGIEKIIAMAERYGDYNFLIVGGPVEHISHYEVLCKDKGLENVEFKGYVPHSEVLTYLYAADILIGVWSSAISTMEFCSPLKVFEYMATGRKIVCEAYTPIKEVLTDKKSGYLADPENIESLFAAFQDALNDHTNEVGEYARNLALQKYTWINRVREIQNLLKG